MEDRFYTTEQVAKILQLHPFTILKFIKQGKLKGVKLGRRYRIKESDINSFVDAQTVKPKENTPKPSLPVDIENVEKKKEYYII